MLVHEVGHLVRAHAERADALGADVDHERWNLAADAAINDDLLAAGVPLPDGAVTPATLGLAEGGIEEVVLRGAGPAGSVEWTSRGTVPVRLVAAPVQVTRSLPGNCPLTTPRHPPSDRRTRA